jgi:hypothetical protein
MATWARRDRRYRDANASTDDFRIVMEQTSGRDLSCGPAHECRPETVPKDLKIDTPAIRHPTSSVPDFRQVAQQIVAAESA